MAEIFIAIALWCGLENNHETRMDVFPNALPEFRTGLTPHSTTQECRERILRCYDKMQDKRPETWAAVPGGSGDVTIYHPLADGLNKCFRREKLK